jgi:hypothetical protein
MVPVKRAAARRVFAEMTTWLRYSSVVDPGIWAPQALQISLPRNGLALARRAASFVVPRPAVISAKTAPLGIFKQALRLLQLVEKLSLPRHRQRQADEVIAHLRLVDYRFPNNGRIKLGRGG